MRNMKSSNMRGIQPDGLLIRDLRKARGLSQEGLAELAACDVKTIRNAEQSTPVDSGTVLKVAEALEVEYRELIHGPEDAWERDRNLVQRWAQALMSKQANEARARTHSDFELQIPAVQPLNYQGESLRGLKALEKSLDWLSKHIELNERSIQLTAGEGIGHIGGYATIRAPSGSCRLRFFAQLSILNALIARCEIVAAESPE